MGGRNTERDGAANELEFHVLTHYEPVWRVLQRPRLKPHVNRLLINSAITKVPTRPNPFSTLAPYTSWSSLTDRSYDAPPPAAAGDREPAARRARSPTCSCAAARTSCAPKSTVLFAYFAQWFTDGFLRSDRSVARDPRRNDSNHEIDLMPLYGCGRPGPSSCARTRAGG